MEVLLDQDCLSTDIKDVLTKWKTEFSKLLNTAHNNIYNDDSVHQVDRTDDILDTHFSVLEVKHALDKAKKGKAFGVDSIPVDVLKNDTSVLFLHVLFNVCFETGRIPSDWGKTIISPIPKTSTADPRDPLSYRGISLASSMYKLYSSMINNRLSLWSEENNKIVDVQNGFRKKRSTIDHISSLTSIIETRKKMRLSTYCAFIDFRKAYDFINRDKLWQRLRDINVSTKMLTAIKSLYVNVSACVKVNNLTTDWFDVKSGLRQGCSLSPLLFNLYINDLAIRINALGKGISLNNDKVSLLMYADDIVLIADSETDLQSMLNELTRWCDINSMSINNKKSNVVTGIV